MKKKFVVIGTSAAAVGFVNKVRQLDKEVELLCISNEKELPYNKCLLADYCAGTKQEQQISTLTQTLCEQKNIQLMLGTWVTKIDSENKTITCDTGTTISFDNLLIATGSSPFIPLIKNINNLDGVFTFHTLQDINNILSFIQQKAVRRAVIIGAGLSGLECADSLVEHKVHVTVVEKTAQVLARQINKQSSDFIAQRMQHHGVQLLTQESVQEVIGVNGSVAGVVLQSGQQLPADMVIVATGLKPNSQLAQQAGITLNNGGIVTNDFMQTNSASIYAAGDVAQVKDQLSGNLVQSCLWPDAMMQGMIAACHVMEQPKKYSGAVIYTSSAFFDIKFVACGPFAQEHEYTVHEKQGDDFYHAFLLANDQLKGFLMIGQVNNLGMLRRALLTGQSIDL